MDKESFAALLEEAKRNPDKEYNFENGSTLWYDNGKWNVIMGAFMFTFNNYFEESGWITMILDGNYLGLIDYVRMEREYKRLDLKYYEVSESSPKTYI